MLLAVTLVGRQVPWLQKIQSLVCLLAVRWLHCVLGPAQSVGHTAFLLMPRVAIWSISCKCETALGLLAGCQGSPQLSYEDNTTVIFYRDQLKCCSHFKHVGSRNSEFLSMAKIYIVIVATCMDAQKSWSWNYSQ